MNPQKYEESRLESFLMSNSVKSFLSGTFSGFCSTVLFQPFDLVKTRLQAQRGEAFTIDESARNEAISRLARSSSHRLTIRGIVTEVVQNNGITGLWRGLTPSLVRTVPGVGLYFGLLHSMKTFFNLQRPNAREAFLLGASSRLLAASLLMPFTVIKARFESGVYQYSGIFNALVQISRAEGLRGLWSGFIATLLRDAPYSGLYLMFYERAKESVKPYLASPDKSLLPLPTVYFFCSLLAGVLASAATQPPDVIKTRMQVNPTLHRSVPATVVYIYRYQGGVAGFFRGFVPRTTRRTLMAATAWTVYEQVMAWMGLT